MICESLSVHSRPGQRIRVTNRTSERNVVTFREPWNGIPVYSDSINLNTVPDEEESSTFRSPANGGVDELLSLLWLVRRRIFQVNVAYVRFGRNAS